MNIAPVPVIRDVTLNPGVLLDGKPLTSCKVRLLTRADNKYIATLPEADQTDVVLVRSIVEFGPVSEREIISALVDALSVPDELRIRDAVAQMEAKCLTEAVSTAPSPLARIVRPSDIVSDPFSLNPGVFVSGGTGREGKWLTSCIVRLLTRGEWKKVAGESDPQKRDDLALLHGIVQLGSDTNITMEHVDALTDVDIERVNSEAERLRALYAPDHKSACPECGHEF